MAVNIIIQHRRDTSANWTSVNPVLHDGELGIERDTGKTKLGDGTTAWSGLSYWNPSGSVSSVFSRTGTIVATAGDYNVAQVTGAAPLASPALTGTPTAPTPGTLDASTKIATTAYADSAVSAEKARAQAAEAAAVAASVPLASVGAASGVLGLDSARRIVSPVGGFLLPSAAPVSRRPAWRASSFAQIFQTGHGWTATGTGVGSSSLNDTSTFIKGTQCATIVTAGNGQQANIRSTAVSAQDLTGKALRLTFKIDDVTHLLRIVFYIGSSAFANYFNWTAHTHSGSGQNLVQSGEWVSLTISWADVQTASGSYTISSTGVPSVTSGFTAMQFAVFDDSAGAVTAHLQAVEVIPGTAATFPNGVISVVFDDSFQSSYDNARPIMDTYGYRGTLYTIAEDIGTGACLTLTELKNLQVMSGWEIGGHAYTDAAHSSGYQALTALQVEDEMRYMRAWMLANGFPLDNFAYPHGTFSTTTDNVPIDQICAQYFASGRTILSETAETFSPGMPYRLRAKTGISSTGGGGTLVSTIAATGGPLDRCQLDGSWYIITMHQVVTSGVSASTMILQSDFSTLMAAINSRGIPVLPVGDVLRNFG